MSNVLMLSNSTLPGTPFFTWPKPWVKDFLGDGVREILFLPFAAVTLPFDEYEASVRQVFQGMGYDVRSLHSVKDKKVAVERAEAIVVGGGNTFALLTRIYEYGLLDIIRKKVAAGVPYVGWSAGANLACPTLMTTNDMPVTQPPSFEALNFVPFQINPHYHELKFEGQGGETRKERLTEFVTMNPTRKVVGLPEGMLLQRNNDRMFVRGRGVAKLYQYGKPVEELLPDADVSALLK